MRGRTPRSIAAVVAVSAAAAGCGFAGPQSLPLPGAVGGDDTYVVTIVLPDAANLVPQETCRTNDTVVGSVESVTLDDQLHARVVCRIDDDVTIAANAVGRLSQTSLLGERYIALDPPEGEQPVGALAPASVLHTPASGVDPDVELVLGALSQVLNGGSLGEVHTITRELTIALENSDLRSTARRIASTVGTLSDGRRRIVASLEAVDDLASRLARQRQVIARALDTIPAGIAALDRQRPRLVTALQRLTELSEVAVPLIERTREDLVADLRHLTPVLGGLAEQGDELALALERLASFPFPTNAMATLKGDYAGAWANAPIDIDWLNQLLTGGPEPDGDGRVDVSPSTDRGPDPEPPEDPDLPQPDLGNLPGLGSLGDLLGLFR